MYIIAISYILTALRTSVCALFVSFKYLLVSYNEFAIEFSVCEFFCLFVIGSVVSY